MNKNTKTGFIMIMFFSLLFVIVYPCSRVFGAQLTEPADMITMDLDDYRNENIYDYNFDDLYGDLYGNLDDNTGTSGTYINPSSLGNNGFSLANLKNLNLPSLYELGDSVLEQFDSPMTKLGFFLSFLMAVLWCFCGYRVFHVFTGITAFILINLVGILVAISKGSGGALLFIFILSIAVLILCIKFKSCAAFLLGSINLLSPMPFFALIFLLICKDVNTPFYVLTVVSSIALGVVAVIFKKPLIIIITALEWGPSAGLSFGCLIHHTRFGTALGIVFIIGGLLYQCYFHGGLLESGPLLIKSFGKNNDRKASKLERLSDVSFSEASVGKKKPASVYSTPKRSETTSVKTKEISPEVAAVKSDTIYCSKCGAKQKRGSGYCTACGATIAGKSKDTSAASPVFADIGSKPEAPAPTYKKTEVEKPVAKMSADHPAVSVTDDSKLKFGSFSRVPDLSPAPDKSGELKISMGESKPAANKQSDPNSRMKPADDFDD